MKWKIRRLLNAVEFTSLDISGKPWRKDLPWTTRRKFFSPSNEGKLCITSRIVSFLRLTKRSRGVKWVTPRKLREISENASLLFAREGELGWRNANSPRARKIPQIFAEQKFLLDSMFWTHFIGEKNRYRKRWMNSVILYFLSNNKS